MSKYILVYKSSSNPQWQEREEVNIFDDFDSFEKRVQQFLDVDNGADAIVLAGEISTEWEFIPEKIVKEYRWSEK